MVLDGSGSSWCTYKTNRFLRNSAAAQPDTNHDLPDSVAPMMEWSHPGYRNCRPSDRMMPTVGCGSRMSPSRWGPKSMGVHVDCGVATFWVSASAVIARVIVSATSSSVAPE